MLLKENVAILFSMIKKKSLKTDNLILFFGFFALIPFVLLSFFANPIADDFAYHCKSKDLGFWDSQLFWYQEWSGRYFATFILSIKPLVSNSFLIYKLIPIVLLLLLFASLYYLCSIVFSQIKKKDYYVFIMFVVIIYIIQMPSISQGLYWLSGSITYQLSCVLSLLLFCFLIKLIETKDNKYLAYAIISAFAVIGLNEVAMFLISFFIFTIFCYKVICRQKFEFQLLVLLSFVFVFALLVIKSPGNAVRASAYPNKNHFIYSLTKAILLAIIYIKKWLPFILVFTIIFMESFGKKIENKTIKTFDIHPLIVFFIVFSIPILGFFTGYWSTGFGPPARTINIIYFYFLIGFIYLIIILYYRMKKRRTDFIIYSQWTKFLLIIVLFIQVFQENNIRTAYLDLISGKAFNYDKELRNRYRLIKNSSKDTIHVPILRSIPQTIFFKDITNDSKEWKNQVYDLYYQPKIIVIEN
jgi:hypothetical protein